MLVKVLKAFPYAREGKFTVTLEEGAIEDIDASVIEGLQAEGFIDEATAEDIEASTSGAVVIPPPVDIPDDWRDLHWFKIKALAEAVTGGPVQNKASAVAVIEAELAARA